MTHDEIFERLDDWFDGALGADQRAAVAAHLEACAECRDTLQAMRELRDEARALPRELVPSRDLWPEIAARIDEKRVIQFRAPVAAPAARTVRAQPWWHSRTLLAAAAVLLMVCSSAVTALWLRSGPGEPAVAVQPAGGAAAAPGSVLAAFEPAEAEFRSAIDDLTLALAVGRDVLDPATVEVLEVNLRIIDRAIAEARAALEADPNNQELAHLLTGIYRRKIDVMKRAVMLSEV